MKRAFYLIFLFGILFCVLTAGKADKRPTLFTIGDSTVKNGQGDGAGGLWGWGDPIGQFFDLSKISVKNYARGGTSSRTFRSLGLWQPVFDQLKKGDYVLIQFGHNDAGPINDDQRARGTITGIGDESEEIDNLLTGKHETVHTYGWYLTRYIREIKAKKAIPVIMSPIPRNDWEDGHVGRNNQSYGLWAKQVAERENVLFIDLNEKMALAMEQLGEDQVTGVLFFKHDHTHTSAKGAVLSASLIVEGIKENVKCKLNKYLLASPEIQFPVKRRIFLIGDSTVADGRDSIIGWGRIFPEYIDTSRAIVINKARGGRSSRTYCYEGLWKAVLDDLKPGDFLLIQFGHNDGGKIDAEKFRGSLPGIGDESREVTRPDSTTELVHSFGWYLKKYVSESKEKGAVPIILSHIPRNKWQEDNVERCDKSYGLWSREVAKETDAFFIDLNELVARKYEELGSDSVRHFFSVDHTHTNSIGARLNALTLAEAIKNLRECQLRGYVELRDIPKE